ncbi:MAG: response regulator [Anaerolineae bacterium]|jgi:CheY-like chemotaxis protein|nr:response regulator [Anaerolineae bacterium]
MSNPIPRTLLAGWAVLIVEDDFDSREIAVRVLRHYGAQVYTAQNGQEALAVLETMTPRFIISDLSMPVMTGWELIARLKADARFCDLPVIALTAHAMVGDKEKATAAGFYDHLTKPLSASNFMRDLVALLQSVPQFTESLAY